MNGSHDTLLRTLFTLGRPLSPVYGGLMRLRARLYRRNILKSHRLPATVISIGNLTMGGTGKTPLVLYLARLLQADGHKPAIISRGYKGGAKDAVNLVSDGRRILLSPEDGGDEPRLLAEALPGVPVLTGRQRRLTGSYAIEQLAADTIIMDDGFQHLAVERDLDLVLFNGRTLMNGSFPGQSRVIPGGDLREPLTALERAHGFVITGVDDDCRPAAENCREYLENSFPGRPVFMGQYRPTHLKGGPETASGKTLSLEEARKIPAFAFCGIANPDSFRQTLANENFTLCGFKSFGDHHRYSARDIDLLRREAKGAKAEILLTTEKDLVKLQPYLSGSLPILALTIELLMEHGFDDFLADRLP